MQEASVRKQKMAALLSPEADARHRAAAILPFLRILEDDGASARKRPPASSSSSSKSGKKKKLAITLALFLSAILLMLAVLKTRTLLYGRILLLHHRPAPTITIPHAPYATHRHVHWDSVAASLSDTTKTTAASVALLNFSPAEVNRWRKLQLPGGSSSVRAVRLEPVDTSVVTWATLYPEWIDEHRNSSSSTCPTLPDPEDLGGQHFDLVAVNLPCRNTSRRSSWSRDVARLHLQLAAAKLAVEVHSSHVLIVSNCVPLPNLFPCKHLLRRRGHASLYATHPAYLRRRVRLPVGSCDLAVRLPTPDHLHDQPKRRREAYATVLHSSDAYVCGAIALAQSIRQQSGTSRDLVALVDHSSVGPEQRAGLEAAGWQVRAMERIRNPHAVPGSYNEWNYSKLRLWQQLTDYRRVVFVDADQLVLRNVDFLFDAPEVSGTGNSRTLFNSGVMVLEPCNCTFEMLMARVNDVRSYNGGDQGFLNEVFTWWHRLPRAVNVLKYYHHHRDGHDATSATSDKEKPYVMHYLGTKPWLCFRDYDCNWNVPWLRRFASDEAHARWWAVHDLIEPKELATRFCALEARQREALESDRRAEMANATDMHWNRTITDPRKLGPLPIAPTA